MDMHVYSHTLFASMLKHKARLIMTPRMQKFTSGMNKVA